MSMKSYLPEFPTMNKWIDLSITTTMATFFLKTVGRQNTNEFIIDTKSYFSSIFTIIPVVPSVMVSTITQSVTLETKSQNDTPKLW